MKEDQSLTQGRRSVWEADSAAARCRAKIAFSSCRPWKPPACKIALRSHCKPKTSSSDPMINRGVLIGTAVNAGPTAATISAHARTAATMPYQVGRQPRVVPTASTMVGASTPSTSWIGVPAVGVSAVVGNDEHGHGCVS